MQGFVCEVCGSQKIGKQADGRFECEVCHCNYTIEQLRQIISYEAPAAPDAVKVKSADFTIRGGVLEKYNGAATDVVIPDNVSNIGKEAFKNCRGITSVKISGSVKTIESSAFKGCTGLTSVTIPDSVTSIGDWAFEGCTGLTSVTIPDSVTKIDWGAFKDCTGLTSVTIPNSITSIGNGAFEGCTGLTSVTIPDSVTSIGESAFKGCTNLNAVYITDLAAWCSISFDGLSSNPLAYAHNLYINGKLVTDLVIPDSVTSIEKVAFARCTGLTSVTIPDSVTSIGICAFWGCTGLTSVTIPDSVMSIGERAFNYCTGLTSVSVSDKTASRLHIDYLLRSTRKKRGVCTRCGGEFNIFSQCKKCGHKKDY